MSSEQQARLPELLTRQECADTLRVSLRTLDKMIASGALPAIRIGERGVRVHKETLLAMINQQAPAVLDVRQSGL